MIKITPDNCYRVDTGLPVERVAHEFMEWIIERTPLGYGDHPSQKYRALLMHPELERWFLTAQGYMQPMAVDELRHALPFVRDHTLPKNVVQVLEHITIEEVQ